MTAEAIRGILETGDKVNGLWTTSLERLQSIENADGAGFDPTTPVPGLNRSLSGIDSRLRTLLDLIVGFDGIDDVTLVPSLYFVNLTNALHELVTRNDTLRDNLDAIDQAGGPGNLDPSSFTLQSSDGQHNFDVAESTLKPINDATDDCLNHYYLLSMVLKGRQYHDFSAAYGEFSRQLKTLRKAEYDFKALIDKTNSDLATVLEQANSEQAKIQTHNEQAAGLIVEIERLKTDSESDRKTIAEYTEEGTHKVTAIRETTAQAESLKGTVEAHQSQFDKFENQLSAREESFTKGKEEQDRLLNELKEVEGEIERLNKQAEDMLKGATVAGLASSFGELRDQLANDLNWARLTFYLAIGILFLAVLPLFAYVVPRLGLLGVPQETASTLEFIAQVLVRALLLLPAAWFAKFTASRHAVLFRLKENYAYKYSLASSVEGFKKQAEPFKDAIAAATFFELTFNPADRMEMKGHEERHPNPVMEWLMKKLGATYDGEST